MQLPDELTIALEALVDGHSMSRLRERASTLSGGYRSAGSAGGSLLQSAEDALAYASYRLPATYAAAWSVLGEVQRLKPGWTPRTLLDFGGGPGTVAWAATAIWPSLERVTVVERNPHMIEIGRRLVAGASESALQHITWVGSECESFEPEERAELVTAAYVLGELSPPTVDATVSRWWSATANTFVAIEPGTPSGYRRALRARQQLLTEAATTIAPCPHDRSCPLPETDWCHFVQRLPRSRLHRATKDARRSYEDEKFSYAAMSRKAELRITSRVIRQPQAAKGIVRLVLCSDDGVHESVASRRDGQVYKEARHLRWGSAPIDERG